MSDTVPPAPPAATPSVDSLWSPQFIIALLGMFIIAGVIVGVFWRGEAATVNQTVGQVLGTLLGGIVGFYLGSSVSSQRKDATTSSAAVTAAAVAATVAQNNAGEPKP